LWLRAKCTEFRSKWGQGGRNHHTHILLARFATRDNTDYSLLCAFIRVTARLHEISHERGGWGGRRDDNTPVLRANARQAKDLVNTEELVPWLCHVVAIRKVRGPHVLDGR
jgi:hypothetical protein